jgi:hypothetical protein
MSTLRSGRTGTKETAIVKFGEIELTIFGYYIEGDKGDHWTAPTASDLEISTIGYNGVDVTDLLTELLPSESYQDIVNKAIEQIESDL